MTETRGTTTRGKHRLARFLAVFGALVCLVPVAAYLALTIYIRTPAAARQASRLLTDHLHHPVTVTGLSLTGRTLSINGLTIGNPVGFAGEFASSRSITVTPAWRAFFGRKIFREISVSGFRGALGRNGQGEWNFRPLARRLAGKKGGGETVVDRFSISQSSLAVEGFRLDNLALNVRDLSTKGTTGSRILVTCRDADGNPFLIEGSARLGPAPSADLVLSAPSFSLQTFAETLGRKAGPEMASGRGALSLAVKLNEGKAAAQGKLGFRQLVLPAGKGELPVSGELDFSGRYDLKRDELSLDACELRLDGIGGAHASGTVRQARTTRSFDATVSLDEANLGRIYGLLPQEQRRGVTLGGRLGPSLFRCSGDALHGITAGKLTTVLRGVEAAKGGRRLVRDLGADASLVRVKEGWQLSGVLFQEREGEGGMLEALKAPFTADFSSRLKLLRAGLPSCTATVLGLPTEGEIGYKPGEADPLTFRLEIGKTPVSSLNRFLLAEKVQFSAGTAAFSLRGAGRSPREFTAKLHAEFASLRGSAAGKEFAASEVVTEASFSGTGGKVSATGRAGCRGLLVAGRSADFAFSFGAGEGKFLLSDGTARLEHSELRFARASGPLPLPVRSAGVMRLPLRLELSGLELRGGAAGLEGGNVNLAADYVSGEGGRRLEGSGAVAAKKLLYKGKGVGSVNGAVRFTGQGGVVDLGGELLAGRLTGTASLDPFAPGKRVGFALSLDGARCERFADFAPAGRPVRVAGGVLGVRLDGSYGAGEGLRCRIEAGGRGIALSGKNGRTLLADGAVRTLCDLSGGDLIIREGVVTAGEGVTVKAQGQVARFLSPGRTGEISLALAETPIDTLLAAFANLLPRGLQEASAGGAVGADARMRITEKGVMLDGELSLERGALEIPSQKLRADDISGTVPFSLDLTGEAPGGRPGRRVYSRENYPAVLAGLRRAAKGERNLKIGGLRFGGMEFGETSLAVRAGDGLVEVTSLKSALFGGTLLGEGFFRSGMKISYGADFAVNNLSLRAFCDSYPKIKGYISGKVDGIVSLYGEGKGVNGLSGFTEIWTRSARDEKMLVSKEFLQKLAGRKLRGIFFRDDRPYDQGEIRGYLVDGYLTFDVLDISHTNIFGMRDLSVSVAPVQNRISLGHLITSVREAATRGKAVGAGEAPPPAATEFKWEE